MKEEHNNSEYDELSVGGAKLFRYADDTALFSATPGPKTKEKYKLDSKQSSDSACQSIRSYVISEHRL